MRDLSEHEVVLQVQVTPQSRSAELARNQSSLGQSKEADKNGSVLLQMQLRIRMHVKS